jgi:hypothetical protein
VVLAVDVAGCASWGEFGCKNCQSLPSGGHGDLVDFFARAINHFRARSWLEAGHGSDD